MKFVKDKAEWNKLTSQHTGLVGQYIHSITNRLVALAKAQVGVKTGQLQRSIKGNVTTSGGIVGTVGSDNPIAYLHHEGTRAHIITPRRAHTLRFASRGRIVYTKIVHHPGTKPNRFLTDNLRKVID